MCAFPSVSKVEAGLIQQLEVWQQVAFDRMPTSMLRTAFGVRYVQLGDDSGGRLWVTRHGWGQLSLLDPARWYADQRYSQLGRRLTDGSGAVYRVPVDTSGQRSRELVVKFSRVAQDVQLYVASNLLEELPLGDVTDIEFNDPFREFGLVEELRESEFGPRELRVLTKRPLAIYSPGRAFESWQLGRNEARFNREQNRLMRDQSAVGDQGAKLDMSLDRQYVTLFQWVHGTDLQQLTELGVVSAEQSAQLVRRAVHELSEKGFRMLDMKPNHLILRVGPGGRLVQRHGLTAYVVVDFELLQRTKEYSLWRHERAERGAIREKNVVSRPTLVDNATEVV